MTTRTQVMLNNIALARWEGWARKRRPPGAWNTHRKGGWAWHVPDYDKDPGAALRLLRTLQAKGIDVQVLMRGESGDYQISIKLPGLPHAIHTADTFEAAAADLVLTYIKREAATDDRNGL